MKYKRAHADCYILRTKENRDIGVTDPVIRPLLMQDQYFKDRYTAEKLRNGDAWDVSFLEDVLRMRWNSNVTSINRCLLCKMLYPHTSYYSNKVMGRSQYFCMICANSAKTKDAWKQLAQHVEPARRAYAVLQAFSSPRTRREMRLANLPNSFTRKQWTYAVDYFGRACAVCGEHGNYRTLHRDHWIPVASPYCPGTIATNIVPLCKKCNLSKNSKYPDVWLKNNRQVFARIEAYFASLHQ